MVLRKVHIITAGMIGLCMLLVLVIGQTTFAAGVSDSNPDAVSLKAEDLKIKKIESQDIVTNTLNAVYSIAAAAAVIVIIAAGLMYITSDGDPGKTSTAKNAIIYAAIGLVFVGTAFIITGVVQNIASNSPTTFIIGEIS